jgi:hypothetical protein
MSREQSRHSLYQKKCRFDKTSFEISAIVALETLNTGLFFAMRLSNLFINFLSAVKAYDSSVLLDGSVF